MQSVLAKMTTGVTATAIATGETAHHAIAGAGRAAR